MPEPDDPQQGLPIPADPRSGSQRGADALAQMARLAGVPQPAGTRAGEPPHLLIHATVEQLAWLPGSGALPAWRPASRRGR